jgi:D-aminoacyl-tRNA deacylase
MKVVLQRVKKASVEVNEVKISSINEGLLILVGFTKEDTIEDIKYLVDKIINLRIFNDENNIMNKSLKDLNKEILTVSQFTLYADAKKGRRPSYDKALSSELAIKMYELFNDHLKQTGLTIKEGKFQAEMQVSLINDGPVTIILESR